MMSDNMSAFFPNAQMDIARMHLDSYQICAIIATLVILPTVWLRNLSLLSYISGRWLFFCCFLECTIRTNKKTHFNLFAFVLSVGGVFTLILVVLCLLWVGATSEIGFHPSGNALNFARLPVTIGIYSFCYGSHSVFPNIYSSMDDPSRFPSLLVLRYVAIFLKKLPFLCILR